jgi:hypothetical protein
MSAEQSGASDREGLDADSPTLPEAGETRFATRTFALNESTAGTVIGFYHLLEPIGLGGMGEVWLAEQEQPVRRRVAIKLIKAGMDTREVVTLAFWPWRESGMRHSSTYGTCWSTHCPRKIAWATRAAVRLAPFFNTDLTLAKTFRLPREGQRVQFRAEAFNVFNNVNFINPSLTLTSPLTFGEFQGVMPPRTMQFALRFEF